MVVRVRAVPTQRPHEAAAPATVRLVPALAPATEMGDQEPARGELCPVTDARRAVTVDRVPPGGLAAETIVRVPVRLAPHARDPARAAQGLRELMAAQVQGVPDRNVRAHREQGRGGQRDSETLIRGPVQRPAVVRPPVRAAVQMIEPHVVVR